MSSTKYEIDCLLAQVTDYAYKNEETRIATRAALLKALSEVETPFEQLHHINFAGPGLTAVLKTGIDMKLFEKWVQDGGGARTVEQLAALTETDPVLLARLLKHMASMNKLVEVGEDEYELTPFTRAMSKPGIPNGINFLISTTWPVTSHLPKFLAATHYQNPVNPKDTNYNMFSGSKNSWFEDKQTDPVVLADFSHFVQMYSLLAGNWTNLYPTAKLLEGYDQQRPLLVDGGGGKGADLEYFREKHPDVAKGSLVLQEVQRVVDQVSLPDPAFTVMTHDLRTAQPVKGARAYFTHSVLHGWTNDEVVLALKHFAEAMQKGYSKLLIHEKVVPPVKAPIYSTSSDIIMMANFSACERTQAEWEGLLAKAGLRLVEVYLSPLNPEGLIEAEVM